MLVGTMLVQALQTCVHSRQAKHRLRVWNPVELPVCTFLPTTRMPIAPTNCRAFGPELLIASRTQPFRLG